jgi:hypothetical protein
MRAFLLVILLSAAFEPVASTAQSVAINADSSAPDPSAILHLKSSNKGFLAPCMTQAQRNAIAAPATGLLIYQTDNTPGFYYYDSTGWTPAKGTGSGGGGGLDSFWLAKGNDFFNTNSGNIGIGTDSIIAKLTVKTADSSWGIAHTDGTIDLSTFIGRGAAYFGTRSNHSLKLFVNGYPPGITISPNRGVGINTDSPRNFFQIGEFQTSDRYTGADFLVTSLGVWTTVDNLPDASKITSNNDIQLHPKKSNGYVGINTTDTLSNYLQIGSVGHTGVVGNHFAMGNGNAAAAMNQYNSLLQVMSTTDIALLPQVNHVGKVGINTTTPKAPLHVAGNIAQASGNYYNYLYNSQFLGINTDQASIIADYSIEASDFVVPSDERVKNIIGPSNTVKDLKTLESLRVTDYTMKDKLQFGNKSFKKVIAQEVEKVYPQVITRQPGFIPNVYRPTDTIQRTAAGLLLHFPEEHHLTADAKKLRAIAEGQNFMEYTIVSIPSPTEVVIADTVFAGKRMFVYGQEVPDFRKVDYDGLFALNISATQELSKEVKQLQHALAAARADNREMARQMALLKQLITGNRLTSTKVSTPKTIAKQAKKI